MQAGDGCLKLQAGHLPRSTALQKQLPRPQLPCLIGPDCQSPITAGSAAWNVLCRLSDQRRHIVVPQMVRVSALQTLNEALERRLCVSMCAASRLHHCGHEVPGLACCAARPPLQQTLHPAQVTWRL